MDNKRIYACKISIRFCGLLLLIFGIAHCSNPADSSGRNEILFQLLDVPEMNMPLATDGNATNPGYLQTVEHLRDIQSYQYFNYQFWLLPFIEEQTQSRNVKNAIVWQRNRESNPEQVVILSVVPGDTLFFDFAFEGPDWGPPGSWFIRGWNIPDEKTGYLSTGGGYEVSWWPTEDGYSLGVNLLDPLVLGYDHVVADLTSGGGNLKWNWGNPLQRFEAYWDAIGHGIWWTAATGSGEW